MFKKFFKELKTVPSIWLVVMIPIIFLTVFHKDIAAIYVIAISSVIGGIYLAVKDIRSSK